MTRPPDDPRFALGTLPSAGILLLRVGTGLTMALAHGWGKLTNLLGDDPHFGDPLGIGAIPSLALAVFGELVCGVLLALGLATRAAAIPFAITMLVAVGIVHGDDPWSDKEHAFLFLVPALVIAITGPGRFSLDALLVPRLRAWRAGQKPSVEA